MAPMRLKPSVLKASSYAFSPHDQDVKLDQNEAFTDVPERVKVAVLARLRELPWHRYPSLRAERLQDLLADRDGWTADGVLVSNGSNVLLQNLMILAGLGRSLVIPEPTFSLYRQQAQMLGIPTHGVPLRPGTWSLDKDALIEALGKHPAGLLVVPSPAAPTGNSVPLGDLRDVLDAASEHGWLSVVDEAYWAYEGRHALDLIRGHDDRLALRTLSKADGLGGIRLGYALGSPSTITELGKVQLPFNVSVLQQVTAETVLELDEAINARAQRIADTVQARDDVLASLRRLPGVTAYDSVTNFVLFKVPDAAAVYHDVLNAGVVLRRQDHLPQLEGCLRMTIGSETENECALDAIERSMAAKHEHSEAQGGSA